VRVPGMGVIVVVAAVGGPMGVSAVHPADATPMHRARWAPDVVPPVTKLLQSPEYGYRGEASSSRSGRTPLAVAPV
jgi:hypothetical protein